MVVYLLTTALALLASLLVERTRPEPLHASGWIRPRTRRDALSAVGLILLFTILFLPEALRINTGNDYAKYVDFFHLIYAHAYVPTEPGFNALVLALYTICGFENYLLVFAVFAAVTIAFFLAAIRQQADDFRFSFFLFLMFGLYFQSYNTVRYYFALALAIWAVRFVLQREWVPFVLAVLIAALFHKSVLVVLVLYPLAVLPWKKWMTAAYAALCASFLIVPELWLKLVVLLYPSYRNTEYLEGSGFQPAGIARSAAVLVLALLAKYLTTEQNKISGSAMVPEAAKETGVRNSGNNGDTMEARAVSSSGTTFEARRGRFYLHATVMALGFYACATFLPFVSRIGYYLTTLQIFYIPWLLMRLPEKDWKGRPVRKWMTGLVILAAVLYFALLLGRMSDPALKLLPYRCFLFSDMPKTLHELRD